MLNASAPCSGTLFLQRIGALLDRYANFLYICFAYYGKYVTMKGQKN